jgi:hypothetical protein
MSRALNINATPGHVTATCAKGNATISAIEALQSGGTRVVMNNAEDVAMLTKIYGSKVITGAVKRTPTRMTRY